jgi:small-conductance mechanosensitive channel
MPPPEPAPPRQVQSAEDRLREVEERIAELRSTLEADADKPEAAAARETPRKEIELLEKLRRALEERRQAEDLATQLTEEKKQLDSGVTEDTTAEPIGDGPPYTLAELDALLDNQSASLERQKLLEKAILEQEEGLEDAESLVRHRQREVRRLQESQQNPDAPLDLRRQLRLANLETSIAQETLDLRRQELANDHAELALVRVRTQRFDILADRVEAQLRISEAQKQSARKAIEEQEEDLRRRIEEARSRVDAAKARWDQREREGNGPSAQQAHRAWEIARDRHDLLTERLQVLEARKTALVIRYDLRLGNLEKREDLEATRDQLDVLLGEVDRWRRDQQTQLRQNQARISELDTQFQTAGANGALERERRDLAVLVREYEEHLETLDQVRLHIERPLNRIRNILDTVSPMERITILWGGLKTAWNYEILEVENSSITVGKLSLALLLLILGTWASRYLSEAFARRILERFRLDEGVVAALQTFTFYLLFLAFFLWALRLVNIPLTVFTFLGGAIAIGVGFGSQNIVNNFMSGLILMAERPVKVGDLVEIDDTAGRVEYIGARSTRIHLGDNSHIIVPNSNLLESRVMNWTLADNLLRTAVEVGVAYGSDLDAVRRATQAALEECERIQESPRPEVLFVDFASDALLFRVLFWVRVRLPLDLERARSELRFQVDAHFREANITIAFPQRDVHFDHPLEIHLRRGASQGGEARAKPQPLAAPPETDE